MTVLRRRIEEQFDSLTKAEKRVAEFLMDHLNETLDLSAQELGKRSGTGAATVVRFCRSCGFVGLSDLKASLQREGSPFFRSCELSITAEDSVSSIKHKVLNYHEAALQRLKLQNNEASLEAAVNALLNAKKVMVSGVGDSSAMAIILNNNLDMQGWETYYSNDPIQEIAHITRLSKGDVMIGFSYSGRYYGTVTNLKAAHSLGVTTIGILGVPGNVAEEYLDIVLYTSPGVEENSFGPQSSLIGDFAMIEMLCSMLAARRPLSREHTEIMSNMIELHRIPREDEP